MQKRRKMFMLIIKKNNNTRLVDYADVIEKYEGFNNSDFSPPKDGAYLLAIDKRRLWILIIRSQCKKISRLLDFYLAPYSK